MRTPLFFIFIFVFFSACTGSQSGDSSSEPNQTIPGATEITGPRGNGNGYGGIIRIDRIILSTRTGETGTQVTIRGSDFAGITTVMIDSQICSNPVVVDSTTITCQLPVYIESAVKIEVRSNGSVAEKEFSVPLPPPPTISNLSVLPSVLRIQGTGFEAGATIYLSEVLCPNVVFVSNQELHCLTPTGFAPSSISVKVTNPSGQFALLPIELYKQVTTALFSATPASGPTLGGTSITLLGDGFTQGIQVMVGLSPCASVVVKSANELDCVTPPGSGAVGISIAKANGQTAELASGAFTYVASLSIASAQPSFGPTTGGTWITVTGTGFQPGAVAYLGQVQQLNTNVLSETVLTFQTSGGSSGPLPLRIVNPDNESRILSIAYSYRNPPNQWAPISMVGEPDLRVGHSAVWTGSTMIVWGGYNASGVLTSGGMYDPVTNNWTPTSLVSPTSAVYNHVAVWTGQRMIVWSGTTAGGYPLTGGFRFDPIANTWTPLGTTNQPHGRSRAQAVWTGSKMIVWGGSSYFTGLSNQTGGVYDPSTDSWSQISTTNVPDGYFEHTAVWTGSRMVVWGGSGSTGPVNTGRTYDPSTNTWESMSSVGAPPARSGHVAVWTGSRMIIWGDWGGPAVPYLEGAFYDPIGDTWSSMNGVNAPEARHGFMANWTGQAFVVWGGRSKSSGNLLRSGATFDVGTQTWSAMTNFNAPGARSLATSVWTGSEILIWGGWADAGPAIDSARYSP